jgi:hypothetical protein
VVKSSSRIIILQLINQLVESHRSTIYVVW